MKKVVITLAFISFLGACQTSGIPDDDEIFEVKDNVNMVQEEWQVDGVDEYTVRNLYHIDTRIYEVVARRTTNKLLEYTAPIYDKATRPTIFVSEVQVFDEALPQSFAYSRKITKDMLENAKAFLVVNNPEDADYFLDIEVETVELKGVETPVITYTLVLSDANEEVLQEWSETIRQVKNDDKSWW